MPNEDYIRKINLLRVEIANEQSTDGLLRVKLRKDLDELLIDAGPSIIPDLEIMSTSESNDNALFAIHTLAKFGNERSINFLQTSYSHPSGRALNARMGGIGTTLCLASAYRRNDEDIKFLINLLTNYYDPGWNNLNAEFNLVAIRAKEAIPTFKSEFAKTPTDPYWKDSLERINADPALVDVKELNNPGKKVIAAIFSNGIPYFLGARDILDLKNSGRWRYEGNTWTFVKNTVDEDYSYYTIEFYVHISPDNKRARVEVDQKTGPGVTSKSNGRALGYEYYLENNSSWQVRWLRMTKYGTLWLL